jgi:hypothetical protein
MTKVELTETQLKKIDESGPDPVDILLSTWEAILGMPLSESEGDIRPGDYSIPRSQAERILKNINGNGLMIWLNKGPSTYLDS